MRVAALGLFVIASLGAPETRATVSAKAMPAFAVDRAAWTSSIASARLRSPPEDFPREAGLPRGLHGRAGGGRRPPLHLGRLRNHPDR